MLHKYIVGPIVWLLFKVISITWRVRLYEPAFMMERLKSKQPMILAHWHGDDVVLITLLRRYRIATMVSTSKDGEMMNSVMRIQGAVTSRGSSTRGSVNALKGLVRLIKSGRNCSMAIDAPKGPRHKVKPGVFEISRMVNAPITVPGVACDRAWRFEKSWDLTVFPKPFAKIVITWGPERPAITRDQDPRSLEMALSLEDALHNQHAEAKARLQDWQNGAAK